LVKKARFSGQQFPAVLVDQVYVLLLSLLSNQFVLLLDKCRQIDGARRGFKAREWMMVGLSVDFGASQKRLRGDAADVHTRSADGAALDHYNTRALAARGDGGSHGRATRTDDSQVVCLITLRAVRAPKAICRVH